VFVGAAVRFSLHRLAYLFMLYNYIYCRLVHSLYSLCLCQSIPWLPLIVGWGSCRDDTSSYPSTSQWRVRFDRTSSWYYVLYGRWHYHVIVYLSSSWYTSKSACVLGVSICLFLLFWYLTLELFRHFVFHFIEDIVVKRFLV
jgi:hypothetical protein